MNLLKAWCEKCEGVKVEREILNGKKNIGIAYSLHIHSLLCGWDHTAQPVTTGPWHHLHPDESAQRKLGRS